MPRAALCLPILLLALVACSSRRATPPEGEAGYPPDFALVFHVDGEADADDPLRRTAQHVVDPARRLRVMLGAGVTAADYPPATARLAPGQMAQLYRLAEATLADSAPPPGAGAEVVYLITLTADGRTDTRRFDADAKPPPAATPLLRQLVALRGGR